MALVINSNIASLTSQRHLSNTRDQMEVAMERMSSGSRINSSMDDAAGLAIANRMTSQVDGLNQAIRNANDGISLAQTAESVLDSNTDILQRMRVLAVQAANDTYSNADRKTLNNEIVQLKEEFNRAVEVAEFNNKKILDGSNAKFTFQVGHTAEDTVTVHLNNMNGANIGTKSWDNKPGVVAPTAVATAKVVGVNEKHDYQIDEPVAAGGEISFTFGGNTYTQAYSGSHDTTMNLLVSKINGEETAFLASYDASVPANGNGTLTVTSVNQSDTQLGISAGAISGLAGTADKLTATYTAPSNGSDVHTFAIEAKGLDETADNGYMTFTYGDTTYKAEFDTDNETTIANLIQKINTAETDFVASYDPNSGFAADNTLSPGNILITENPGVDLTLSAANFGGQQERLTATHPAATAGVTPVGAKDTFDFSNIEIGVGDRVRLKVGDTEYVQEFTTDKATTLQALGALVVNGEGSYASKSYDAATGSLVFTGKEDGSEIAQAHMYVETGTVPAANSVNDVVITDSTSAKAALDVLDNALEMIADFRSRMGAASNRMYHTVHNLMNVSENISAARSRIEDADFAAESAALAKNQILQQAGTAMLAQANNANQDVLSLLK